MKHLFLFLVAIAIVPLVTAIPVTYIGTIDWGETGATAVFKAVSASRSTNISIIQDSSTNQTPFTLNHLENPGEEVDFYFSTLNVRSKAQPLPGTIYDLGTIVIPYGTPSIDASSPVNATLSITEEDSAAFGLSGNESRGADLYYYWYLNDILVSDEQNYTFVGNNTNDGSNAGTYTVKASITNLLASTDNASWSLTVTRVSDIDGDGVSDENDNCVYVENTNQNDEDEDGVGDACASDFDGDGLGDDEFDNVIGNDNDVTTNIPGLTLSINGSAVDGEAFLGEQIINFTNGTDVIVQFPFDFTNRNLTMGNITIQKQPSGSSYGGITIEGIDLTGQGTTKSAYLDRLSDEDYVCVKDIEIASITEGPSSACSGAGEIAVPCSTGGSSASGYTCTIIGSQFKVDGLSHSGVSESTFTPPAPSPSPTASGGGGGGGGSGGGASDYRWECTAWSACSPAGTQTRTCTNIGASPGTFGKPAETESCTYVQPATTSSGGQNNTQNAQQPSGQPAPGPEQPSGNAITGFVTGAMGAVGGFFGAHLVWSWVLIIIAVAVLFGIYLISRSGGLPLGNDFDRAARLHRKATMAHQKGKYRKAEALRKRAQILRENAERRLYRNS